MVNKDMTHPAMRRPIINPRIILLDCPLEYKKGESQTNTEISKETDWVRMQENEEEQVKGMCHKIMDSIPTWYLLRMEFQIMFGMSYSKRTSP